MIEEIAARGGPHRPRLARRPGRPRTSRADSARAVDAALRASCSWPPPNGETGAGARPAGLLPAQARRARGATCTSPRCHRTIVYKGMLTTPQVEPFFPDLSDRALRERDRAGPLALLHQHLPLLGAGPPVPLHRPQRRDQHRQGQPQLDARPRGAAGVRRPPRRPVAALPDHRHRGPATPPPSTRGWSCSTSAGASAAARGADDDPRGVGEPHRDGPGAPGVLRVPLHAHGGLGRPRQRHLLRRHRRRRRPRPQRAAPRPVLGHRRTGWSCWPARPACSTSTPANVVRKGRLQPGKMFLSTPSSARSSRTTRSRPSWPPNCPTPTGCTPGWSASRSCRPARTRSRPTRRWSSGSRPSATPSEELRIILSPMAKAGIEPIGSMGTDTPRRGAQREAPPAVRLLQPAVRAGHQPAAGRDPRGARHLPGSPRSAPRANLLAPGPGLLPPARAALPDARQRRAREDHPHQRRGRRCRASTRTWCPACTRSTGGGERRCSQPHRGDLRRGLRGDQGRRADPRAVRPRRLRTSWRRSRRCCSPAPSTTT